MRATLIFALTQIKRFFRDPVALFFTILFPLIFLFVFGSIFRGGDDLSFKVAVFNHSETSVAKEFVESVTKDATLDVQEIGSLDEAKEKMGRGELDSILELPASFGEPNTRGFPSGELQVYYRESSPETGQTLASVMQSVLNQRNNEITQSTPPFTVAQKATTTSNLTQFDFTFAGLLGFSIMSLGIFGLANQLPAEKKNGSLRRIRATPFGKTQLIFGTMLYYGFIGMLSIIIMLIVGVTVFGFDMRGDWLQLAMLIIIATVLMLGFGLLIGGCAKNENQSAVLTNIIAFPLMFLSGTFFPRFLMPEWLQGITGYLPLTPVIDGIRYITAEAKTLLDLGPELAIIGVWIVVVYVAAIKLFRWE